MARGWESKSVEDQIAEAEGRHGTARPPELTPEAREREATRAALSLSRSRILQDLQTACNRIHRGMLERALADVEAAIRKLP
jgi:hypothetical protein